MVVKMKHFVKHASSKHNIRRAIKVALVVGTVLGVINHYDMFLTGEYSIRRFVQIGITYLVPFFVSLHGGAMYGRHLELKSNREGVLSN